MGYIGVQPTDTYLSIASQQITGNGGATYTLDYSVSNEEDVAVFVNNVRQNVSTYTVSSNQLTLGGTISVSDSCWVLFLGRTVGTKTPAVGSVTNDMLAGSINESKLLGSIPNSKLANSSITLNGSAVSLGGSATVGGNNTPSFQATMSGTQTITASTATKVQFDTESFDTDGAYDNATNYRFTVPSGEGGKYFVNINLHTSASSSAVNGGVRFAPYVNGTQSSEVGILTRAFITNETRTNNVSGILTLSESDYVEVYVFLEGATEVRASVSYGVSNFSMYKLIGV